MELKIRKREGAAKSELGQIRREGNIPAVLYSPEKPSEMIVIDGVEMKTVLRNIVAGRLSTTRFTLVDGEKEVPAIVKGIQYHPTTYQILHMDFMTPSESVKIRVPIECVGMSECQGIKLGGFLRQVIRYAKIECAPDKIPDAFFIDIRDLVIGESKRMSDLTMPEGIRSLDSAKEVIAVVAKR